MKRIGFAAVFVLATVLAGCRGADISVSKATEQVITASAPESTSAPETEAETTASEPEITTAESGTQPPEPEERFELPEEFYSDIAEIIERHGLNPNCDGSDECGCAVEYEEVDAEGNVITPRDRIISIYYRDIESGVEYELNSGAHYPIASTVKIPFCTLIYRKIDEGYIDPEQVLTYEQRHYFAGTGVIVGGDFGQQYTVRELLTLAITRSDNVAYEMLKDLVSWEEFSDYLREYGCTHEQDLRRSKQKICTESAGAYGRILAEYIRDGSDGAKLFGEDLLNTRIPMIVSEWPVYRKYGWAGFSFHDIAYVDAPRPYILAILTNFTGDEQEDYEIFREICETVERYGEKKETLPE